jgi:two-component system CheB/CheR fusion protein
MFSVNGDSIIGRNLKDVYNDVLDDNFRVYVDVIETGKPARIEVYYKKYDKWFETIAVKMLDGLVTTHTDITERKKAADLIAESYEELKKTSKSLRESNTQLEQSNLDLMQFASVASHDLKEPLRKIQTFGNILQTKLRDKLVDGEMSYLNKMISASGRMQALIEDVLTLAKLSNNTLPSSKVNLRKIVKRIQDDLEITIKEKKAVINIGQLPELDAVPGQMHQLFQNLISNALKFNDKDKPVIDIREEDVYNIKGLPANFYDDRFACIQVIDNGIGFEQEYVDKIFGIFQRLHGRQFDGTGIGLALSKKIVENHHGLITANGKPGEGSVFTIVLPRS